MKENKICHRPTALLVGDSDLKSPKNCQVRWLIATFLLLDISLGPRTTDAPRDYNIHHLLSELKMDIYMDIYQIYFFFIFPVMKVLHEKYWCCER